MWSVISFAMDASASKVVAVVKDQQEPQDAWSISLFL